MQKIYQNILKHLTMILIILIMAAIWILKYTQNDLFFDLKTGQTILKYGIDFKDHFSFIPNLTYLYHHYLYDLLIYKIFSLFNFSGVFLFFLFMYSLIGLTVYKISYNYSHSKILSLSTSLITMYFMDVYCTNRVQTITYLLFFIYIYFLNQLYETGNKRYLFLSIPISILIVNLHMPIWILTLIFYLPFLFETIINTLITKFPKIKKYLSSTILINKPQNPKLIYISFIILILTGLISPFKLSPYTFFTKALGNSSYLIIKEMQKTIIIERRGLIFLTALAYILINIFKTKVHLRDLALILGILLFSLIANRNIAYLYLLFPITILKIFTENYHLPQINITKTFPILSKFKYEYLYFIIFICLLISYISSLAILKNNDYDIEEDYPDEIVEYLKENTDYKNIILYNDFNYGSYLEFQDIPVFIDSRAEVYIKEFNGGEDILTDYKNSKTIKHYKEIFNKYNFEYALTYYEKDPS